MLSFTFISVEVDIWQESSETAAAVHFQHKNLNGRKGNIRKLLKKKHVQNGPSCNIQVSNIVKTIFIVLFKSSVKIVVEGGHWVRSEYSGLELMRFTR